MLPAIITKEQCIFPGNRKPVLEVICPHQCNQPLGSLASVSRKLLEGSPYGNAFPTRVVAHPEFAFGFSHYMKKSVKAAENEVLALCAEKGAIVIFNITEGIYDSSMMLLGVVNYGYLASAGKMKKAKKIEQGKGAVNVSLRAIEKNGLYIVSLVCYEATLRMKNALPDQIAIVSAFGFPAKQAEHNVSVGKAFIMNDLLGKRACGEFRQGDFWVRKSGAEATYFWHWA
jgi:hypothetical protein